MDKIIKTVFFDFDETVISFKSMFSFLEFYLKEMYQSEGEKRFAKYMSEVKGKWLINVPREEINLDYYRQFKGETKESVLNIRENWIANQKAILGCNFYINETQELINKYRRNNISIVIVSGSMQDIIEPLANEVGADTVLATNMVVNEGVFTGEIIAPQTIGQGKALAISNYMQLHGIAREYTIAWGDHESDFPMLEAAGYGGILSNDLGTLALAQSRGFSTIQRKAN